MPRRALLPSLCRLVASGGGLASDAVRVARLLREVEAARWAEGPAGLVERLRARGRREAGRTAPERRRLARVIYHLDRWLTPEPNCYRRSLVRIALDRDAAGEPVVFGLDLASAGPRGHAWVDGTGEAVTAYDVEFRL